MLAKLMQDKICVAVSGAHGKTTTTASSQPPAQEAGLCPTAAIGGDSKRLGAILLFGPGKRFCG